MSSFYKLVSSIFVFVCYIFVVNLKAQTINISNDNNGFFNTFLNGTYKAAAGGSDIPDIINQDTTYTNKTLLLDHDLTIDNSSLLTFNQGTNLSLAKGTNIYNNKATPKDIVFDSAVLTAEDANIYSGVTFKNSVLTFVNGHIDNLTVTGTADIAVKGTTFNSLSFDKNLGDTSATKTGVGFESITANTVNIDVTGMQNDVTRGVNIKDATIDNISIKGYMNIDPSTSGDTGDDEKLKTNFSFDGGKVKNIDYTDPSVTTLVNLPSGSAGVVNFKDTKINTINVSYNLLRDLSFNGAYIENFNLKDTDKAPTPTQPNPSGGAAAGDTPKPPPAPSYSNLQLMGTDGTFIRNFNLGGAKSLNIEGEVQGNYDAALSSLTIYKMQGYDANTKFSLYNLKNVSFGMNLKEIECLASKEDCDKKKKKPKPKSARDDIETPGGKNPTINITYLQKVTSLGIYNNTVKFNWDIDQVTKNLTIYNLSKLTLENSLINVSRTQKSSGSPADCTIDPNDPSKCEYDLDFRYAGSMQSYGTILELSNSGAIIDDKRDSYVPLRIRVEGNAFVTANDMLSDLTMNLNGERNLFTLKSNKNNKSYSFHTNYKYCYLNPVDGNQLSGCPQLQYNYWNYNESQRVEQNWYTFNNDMVVADKDSQQYKDYKASHGGKDFATTWFTYYQPYQTGDDKKGGDQCAWDQGTDGTGRGGFPCEFGNKLQINAGTTTLLQALDNLTVLEVVGTGEANFNDMDPTEVSTKDSQWITKLRMRAGILRMAKVPMYIDKLEVYSYGSNNAATFRPVFEPGAGAKVTDIFDQQKIVINKDADFHNNYLKVDLYFNKYFIGLNQKITLNILELGQYTEKEKDDKGNETGKDVTKDATIEGLAGVNFDQGIVFDTNYYWKDNKLYVEITRTKDFGYFIRNKDRVISNLFDDVVNKYSTEVDKDGHFQYIDDKDAPELNNDTLKIINSLFKAQSVAELSGDFMSLRPLNNEFVLNITALSSERLLDSIKNSNNYSYESNKGKLALWANTSVANSTISNTDNILGSSINTQTYVVGASTKFNKFKVGGFLGYANADFSSSYYSGNAPLYGGGLYSELGFGNNYFVKLNGIIANTEFKGTRKQYFMLDQADFNFKANNAEFSFNFGKSYIIKSGFLTPYISTNFGYLMVDSYKESGGSATLNVDSFTAPYYSAGFGAEYAAQINIAAGSLLIPKVGAAYNFRYYNLKDTVASFNKINGINDMLNHINYSSNNYDPNSLTLNAGLNYLLSTHSSFSSNFTAELINKDLTGYTFFVGYKYSF